MSTTATLNLLLCSIFLALVVAVVVRRPDPATTVSPARRGPALFVGLASSVLGYVLTGLEGWEDFHLSVFAALAITLAAAAFLVRSSAQPLRFSPIALWGYLGIVSPPILFYALLGVACIGKECCLGC